MQKNNYYDFGYGLLKISLTPCNNFGKARICSTASHSWVAKSVALHDIHGWLNL